MGTFLPKDTVSDKIFTRIRSVFSRYMSQTVGKCPISQCWKSF